MKSKLLLGLFFVIACAALWSADRGLRHLMKMDAVVLQGQTGLSWIDELFAKRTAQQAELAKLQANLMAARTPAARVAAHMAMADFENKWHRARSRRRVQALRAVIAEKGDFPQSATAYRELIQGAQADDAFTEARALLDGYVGMIRRMPAGHDKLLRLLEACKFSEDLQQEEMEMYLLATIHAEFPVAVEAMGAYEMLKSKYRAQGKAAQLAAVEKSIEATRFLIVRMTHEEELSKDVAEYLRKKDLTKARETFFTMTPGLSTRVNYWDVFAKILADVQKVPTNGLSMARQTILKASEIFPPKALNQDQQAALFLSSAFFSSQTDQWKEAQANLSRAPTVDRLKLWQQYIQARCWLAGCGDPLALPTYDVAGAPDSVAKMAANETAFHVKQGSNVVVAIPATRWSLACNATSATLDVRCAEPEPSKMVVKKSQRDSNVWEDDSVEVYLMPVRGEANMVQFVVNAKGALTDLFFKPQQALLPTGMESDVKWNSSAQAKAVPYKDGWGVRITIPWRDAGVRYSDGACFLNIRRLRYVTGKLEVFSWTELGLTSRDPASLGLVVFPNRKIVPPPVKP